jgi:hypothetical protein
MPVTGSRGGRLRARAAVRHFGTRGRSDAEPASTTRSALCDELIHCTTASPIRIAMAALRDCRSLATLSTPVVRHDHACHRARVLDVPLALVSLVDDRQQFFPGATGLTGEMLACRSTPISHSFCKHVVMSQAVSAR